jgi:hypothetical protein
VIDTLAKLAFRLGFRPRHRHQVLGSRDMEPMEHSIRDLCADFGAELRVQRRSRACVPSQLPAHGAISRLVNTLKGVSSCRLRQEFPATSAITPVGLSALVGRISPDRPAAPDLCPAPVHRTAEPSRPTGSRPAAFTAGLKAGALAAIFGSARQAERDLVAL